MSKISEPSPQESVLLAIIAPQHTPLDSKTASLIVFMTERILLLKPACNLLNVGLRFFISTSVHFWKARDVEVIWRRKRRKTKKGAAL